jgi:methylated-DNA-[protein]-cysteine S-methyltransferase
VSEEHYTTFDSAIGTIGLVWADDAHDTDAVRAVRGVRAVQLPERTEAATRERMLQHHPEATRLPGPPPMAIARAIEGIVALVSGRADDLRDVAVDLGSAPEFHRQVYALARECGPGQTTTYGEIATRLGDPRASREVGQALGHNPVPLIVPCHRVLAAGGKLGGFSARGGVTTKLRLLSIEGAEPNGQPALF